MWGRDEVVLEAVSEGLLVEVTVTTGTDVDERQTKLQCWEEEEEEECSEEVEDVRQKKSLMTRRSSWCTAG